MQCSIIETYVRYQSARKFVRTYEVGSQTPKYIRILYAHRTVGTVFVDHWISSIYRTNILVVAIIRRISI